MASLTDHLKKEKVAIVQKWLRKTLDTYPGDASVFFAKEKDQFANPVGQSLERGTRALFDVLVDEKEMADCRPHLDDIVRIRAVQDFSAADAVAFVFMLKDVLHNELRDHLKDPASTKQLMLLFTRIDQLALLAFNAYVGCREKIYEIRVNEVKRNASRLLIKTGLIESDSDLDPDRQPGNLSSPYPK